MTITEALEKTYKAHLKDGDIYAGVDPSGVLRWYSKLDNRQGTPVSLRDIFCDRWKPCLFDGAATTPTSRRKMTEYLSNEEV